VVLGTGWAALSFIQHMDLSSVNLTVISPRPYFFYTPLLAGTVKYQCARWPLSFSFDDNYRHRNGDSFSHLHYGTYSLVLFFSSIGREAALVTRGY
jgi:NADH dehydrogenase FAD-containing subunit